MKEITEYQHLLNPQLIFVAFDFETTGLSYNFDRIIEIGAVKFRYNQELERFSQMVNPEIPIPADASAVNGISDDMVKDAPTGETAVPQFLNFIGQAILVAHNASFDVAFLRSAMNRWGLGQLKNDVVDTQKMAQKAFPGRSNYKLQLLAQDLKITSLEAHRAEDDSRVCMELFTACLKQLNPGGQASFF